MALAMKHLPLNLLLLLLFSPALTAQEPSQTLEYELESLAETNENSETDLTQLAENLASLEENPLAINFATAQELLQIPFISPFQVDELLRYRENSGPLLSRYELAALPGWDRNTIRRVLPFVQFSSQAPAPELSLEKAWRYARHNLILRQEVDVPLREGFRRNDSSGYLGPPLGGYLRYRGQYGRHIQLGLLGQHDPGEPWGGPYQATGIDHLAGFAALKDYGKLQELILGDYQAEFGQGLALWSSLAFGKGANATGVQRFASGFRPFSGSEENRFFRGLAVSYGPEQWQADLFYSRHALDANVSLVDSFQNPELVSSLPSTGLHRTFTELANKNQNTLSSYGGHFTYRAGAWEWGLTAVQHALSTPLAASDRLYRRFRFKGSQLQNYSLDFQYRLRKHSFFGEVASDDAGHLAATAGLESHPAPGLFTSLVFRALDKRYRAIYNAPFAETGSYGERGAYMGLRWEMASWLHLRGYLDLYEFSWLRFGVDAPAGGREWLVQLTYPGQKGLSGYLRWNHETRQVNADEASEPIAALARQVRQRWRAHLSYQPHPRWELSSRLSLSHYQQESRREWGQMVFQDLRYTTPNKIWQFTSRFALIRTPSFASRLYAYENDVLYAFSIPAYFGRAFRFYLLTRAQLNEWLTLEMRYARSRFFDRQEISSGRQTISGPQQHQLSLQLRFSF
jgi:hypothetical protein